MPDKRGPTTGYSIPDTSYHRGVFSVSPAELITIAVVALVVFGPRRLPEIARRAGRILRDLRNAAQEFKSSIEQEYEQTLEPMDRVRRELSTGADRAEAGDGDDDGAGDDG